MSMQSRWNRVKGRVKDTWVKLIEDDFEEEYLSPDEPEIPVDPTQDVEERLLKGAGEGRKRTAQCDR